MWSRFRFQALAGDSLRHFGSESTDTGGAATGSGNESTKTGIATSQSGNGDAFSGSHVTQIPNPPEYSKTYRALEIGRDYKRLIKILRDRVSAQAMWIKL